MQVACVIKIGISNAAARRVAAACSSSSTAQLAALRIRKNHGPRPNRADQVFLNSHGTSELTPRERVVPHQVGRFTVTVRIAVAL